MRNELKTLLRDAGLSGGEIAVYTELLDSPSQTKWELVLRTGLNRNMVYRAFESLENMDLIKTTDDGIEAMPLDYLVDYLENSQEKTKKLVNKIKKFAAFSKIPTEAIGSFQVLEDHNEIMEKYYMMSQIKYDTCLDFGDLERFIPTVLGDIEKNFKFRQNRFEKNSKNLAICTNFGPYTSCMMRKKDMDRYKSNIDVLDIDFKDKWIIFSDTSDYMLFNYFTKDDVSSVLVKSKIIADVQRAQFNYFHKTL